MSYNVEPCTFKYRVSSLEKVVDGDTIDVNIDLGFDVCTKQRVRLLGIDTPESRTRDLEEKKFGLLSKKKLKEWCLKAVASEKDDIEIELRCPEADSRGKFGRVLAEIWVSEDGQWTNVNRWMCEEGYAVPYVGQNKADVEALHMANREKVKHQLL
jgi:micrococcal nuclease